MRICNLTLKTLVMFNLVLLTPLVVPFPALSSYLAPTIAGHPNYYLAVTDARLEYDFYGTRYR